MSATDTHETGEVIDGTAVEVYQPPQPPASLFRTDDPVEVITKATAVADALKSVVASRGLISNISGREHPKVEAWQTLGSMLGVFPVKEWVRPVPWPTPIPEALKVAHGRGLAFGFEASFVAQRSDGAIVGGGEAACMRTERSWSGRDDYALRSMAQTRATSKALKAPLGFVMVLAGYEATPAEEMPAAEPPAPPPPPSTPLDDAALAIVAQAVKEAKPTIEALRIQLVALGVHSVPEGKITLDTLRGLSEDQAKALVDWCNAQVSEAATV